MMYPSRRSTLTLLLTAALIGIITLPALAGGGDVSEATKQVSGVYKVFKPFSTWISGICACIGAVEVFSKFSNGDHDAKRSLIFWASAILVIMCFPSILDILYRPHSSDELVEQLNSADTKVRGAYWHSHEIMLSWFAIFTCMGAISVYRKWQSGDPDMHRLLLYWFGAFFFGLLVLAFFKDTSIFGTLPQK